MAAPNLRPDHACLIVHGKDQPGIVAAVSALITRNQGNIVAFDQYSDDPTGGAYFQRVVFHRPDLAAALPEIRQDLEATLRDGFELQWSVTDQSTAKRMAILASKQDHCLLDLLWRHRRGDLPVSIPMVISNHTTAAEDVRSFGVPFFHVPSTPGPDKSASEARILDLLAGNVLAQENEMKVLQMRLMLTLRSKLTVEQRAKAGQLRQQETAGKDPRDGLPQRMQKKFEQLRTAIEERAFGGAPPEEIVKQVGEIQKLAQSGQPLEAERQIDLLIVKLREGKK